MVVVVQKKGNDVNDFRAPVAQSKIEIVGQDIQVAEYLGHRVITFAMIDRLHRRPSGTAKNDSMRTDRVWLSAKTSILLIIRKGPFYGPLALMCRVAV
ncbi:hypothetical protein GGI1_07452 [Acidithiobacillus sp. GGI-221]|nr:hypothetical protein GGI1_07452 [Acidithiobacillus sp. GGI-221]